MVKLLYPRYVLAGHLDGRITAWDLELENTVDLVGHAGAIFSLDANAVRENLFFSAFAAPLICSTLFWRYSLLMYLQYILTEYFYV